MSQPTKGSLAELDQAVLETSEYLSSKILQSVHRDLHTPDPPAGVFEIARHIRELHPKIKSIAGDCLKHLDLWADAVGQIPEDHAIRSHPEQKARHAGDGHLLAPLRGLYSSHPLWCVLWHQHAFSIDDTEDQSLPEAYQWLQAHFLVVHSIIAHEGTLEEAKSAAYHTSLLLRELHVAEHVYFLEVLKPHCAAERDLAKFLADQFGKTLPNAEKWSRRQTKTQRPLADRRRGALSAFCRLLVHAHGLTDIELPGAPITAQKKKGGKTQDRNKLDPNRIPPDHSQYGFLKEAGTLQVGWRGHRATLHHHRVEKKTRDRMDEDGQDPREYESEPSVALDANDLLGDDPEDSESKDFNPENVKRPHLGTVFALAAARGRHIAVDNQRQRVDRRRARAYEIQLVVTTLNRLWEQHMAWEPTSTKEQTTRHQNIALLQMAGVGLATGTPPDVLHRMQVIQGTEATFGLDLAWDPTSGTWIRPYRLPFRRPLNDDGQLKPAWIVLPDVWGAARSFYGAPNGSDAVAPEMYWQHYRIADLRRWWKDRIRNDLKEAGVSDRWSDLASMIEMIPSWLSGQEEGDQLTVAALFDRPDALAETHRYYTAYTRGTLSSTYRDAMQALSAEMSLSRRSDRPNDLLALEEAPSVDGSRDQVGTDRAPTFSAVTALVARLQEPQGTPGHGDLRCLVAEHNRVTAYTAIGLALATGFRAVRTPITDLTKIHRPTSTMLLREKDQWDGRHTRLAVLPDTLVRQIDQYLAHLQRLYLRMPLSFSMDCEVEATKNRDRSRYRSDAFRLDLRKTLFFLLPTTEQPGADEWEPVELTGDRLRQQCEQYRPGAWPVGNAGRHFLRTCLTEFATQGEYPLPTTAINALLGHWRYGEEPWTPQSAFDPVRYREILLPALDDLLARVGYKALEPAS
ncbi:hypothetical protein [Thioalkalivibrio sp. ALE11]|uniref:hypothetical protein n=1 Tax=Thioalkalivibrio sp. ALE11 TaxID=1265494 RepID=UPI00039F5310|nr:hypothetical protein [Thioalkalivibrio sp. ALE11]